MPTDRKLVRAKYVQDPDTFVIYSLRALQARMGLGNLIEGFALLQGKISNAKLVIGGKGNLRNELEKLAFDLGVADSVTFLGYVPDGEVVERYQAADVVIMPSLDGEGFGLPVLEAMACGTPVLASPACALPEVLKGKPARLFQGTDPGSIAEGILSYYRQWRIRGIDATAERRYVTENFAESEILELIFSDYGIN